MSNSHLTVYSSNLFVLAFFNEGSFLSSTFSIFSKRLDILFADVWICFTSVAAWSICFAKLEKRTVKRLKSFDRSHK